MLTRYKQAPCNIKPNFKSLSQSDVFVFHSRRNQTVLLTNLTRFNSETVPQCREITVFVVVGMNGLIEEPHAFLFISILTVRDLIETQQVLNSPTNGVYTQFRSKTIRLLHIHLGFSLPSMRRCPATHLLNGGLSGPVTRIQFLNWGKTYQQHRYTKKKEDKFSGATLIG